MTPLPAAAVNVRRSADRGHANHGWLDTYHTFSFAGYSDPEFTQFGPLRVLNQDRVTGGGGFPMHGHRDMEIVSFVLEGEMAHRDTMGNGSIIRPGDVQLMSAGHGVRHSEFNASDSAGLHFLQMWVLPAERSTEPRYEQRAFTRESRENRLRLVVSPQGEEGSLTIGQDASLYTALLAESRTLEHRLEPGRAAWLHLASGDLRVNGQELEAGDGAAIVNPSSSSPSRVDFLGRADAEFVLWDVPV
ncbi:MAG: pirin family protein [Planctomycetota bacterium]